jgi:hypothetical protein
MPDIIRQWPWEQSDKLIYAWPENSYPHLEKCKNCGPGLGQMFAWRIKSGPSDTPVGKGHWMDLAGPHGENLSGWYDCEFLHADCPSCRSGRRGEFLRDNSGLEGDQFQVSFSIFSDSPKKQPVIAAVRQIVSSGKGWLTLHGVYGNGKTSMLFSAVNETIKSGNPAYYITAANLLADIRRHFSDDKMSSSVEDTIAGWIAMPFLCIDEIDRVSVTQWTQETLFRILDARYQAAESRATLLVTNTAPDAMKPEFGYLVSRMHVGKILQIPGDDMRKAKR